MILLILLIAASVFLIWQLRIINRFSPNQLRKDLREKDLLNALINNMPDRIYVKDQRSRFLIANKHTATAMGVSDPGELIGKTDFDFYDEEIASIYFSDEKKIMEQGIPMINKEGKGVDNNGRALIISTTKIPLHGRHNKIVGIVGIGRDITKLKDDDYKLKEQADNLQEINALLKERQDEIQEMAEEMNSQSEAIREANLKLGKLSLVASKTHNIVVIMDGNGNFEWVNQGFEEFYGYTLEQFTEKLGVNLRENSFNDNISAILNQIYITRKPYTYNSKTVDKEGLDIWYQTNITPILDENGEINYLVLIDSDITDLKRAEGQIKKQKGEIEMHRDELRKLNATKDRLFSIIAHDLKNPFHSIIGFSELLQEEFNEFDEASIKEYIDLIHTSSVSAYQLLQNLLEWARSQANLIKYNPELISIKEVIRDTIDLQQLNAKNKNIKLIDESNKKDKVWADHNMVKTIIRNLVSNAIKFTNEGGSIIFSTIQENSTVNIMVRDTGIGMPEEKIKTLFKLEDVNSTAGTAGETGTGLGLIICKEFVEKNSGLLVVSSQPGSGSTFTIILPASSKELF